MSDQRMNVRRTLAAGAAATIIGLALTACDSPSTDSTTSSTDSASADGPATLACTHFRNVMSDVSKGILTTDQLVSKMQEVENNTSISTDAGIPDGGQALLAAAIAQDPTAFETAASAFGTACSNAGV